MSCIDTRVNDLLDSKLPNSPIETLARTQALLLYQIIRFFDGDILARTAADATFSELGSSISALSHYISWPGDNGVLSKCAIPSEDADVQPTTPPPAITSIMERVGLPGVGAADLPDSLLLHEHVEDDDGAATPGLSRRTAPYARELDTVGALVEGAGRL